MQLITVASVFGIALLASLVLTPLCGKLGVALGFLDVPDERKVHRTPIPRTGGVAIYLGVLISLLVSIAIGVPGIESLKPNEMFLSLFVGATLVFLIGVLDDRFGIPARYKLVVQLLAASIAYYGGIRVENLPFWATEIDSWVISYLLTLFWFALLINTVNLMDALDGLAGGVVLFSCLVMIIFSFSAPPNKSYFLAVLFSAIGGAVLGFLRYNFNPASIFMGDGGSYFLGFFIAALTLMGAGKTRLGTAMLIPIVALGLPIIDTILAPLRRFVRGKKVFSPDRRHIHHKLLDRGYTSKQVVLFIYGVTAFLCFSLIILEFTKEYYAGGILLVFVFLLILIFKKIGYLEYFVVDKVIGWIYDMLDTSGLTSSRRTFLDLQIEISRSRDCESLWSALLPSFALLALDVAELDIRDPGMSAQCTMNGSPAKGGFTRRYIREGIDYESELCMDCLLKVELPLLDEDGNSIGILWLVKDLKRDKLPKLALRRFGQLRRSVVDALVRIRAERGVIE